MDSAHTLGRALLVMLLPALIPDSYMPAKKWAYGDVWILPLMHMGLFLFVITTSMRASSRHTVFLLERLVYCSLLQSAFLLFFSHRLNAQPACAADEGLQRLTAVYLLFDLVYYAHQWTEACSQHSLWAVRAMRCLAYLYFLDRVAHVLRPFESVGQLENRAALSTHFQAMFIADIGRCLFNVFSEVALMREASEMQDSGATRLLKPLSS